MAEPDGISEMNCPSGWTTVDEIAEECLKRFILGESGDDGRVTERWIVQQFDTTHAQAREVLHRLEKRGAVISSSRRGARLVSAADGDHADVRPLWLDLLERAIQLVIQRGHSPVVPSVHASPDNWQQHLLLETAITSLGEAGDNAKLTEILQRLAIEVAVASGGRTPIAPEVLIRIIGELAAGRGDVALQLVPMTFLPSARRHDRRRLSEGLLRGVMAQVTGTHAGIIQDYFNRVAGHVGATYDSAPAATEQLAAAIRQRIQFGELRPGEPVRELPLAQAFRVSRGPVRDALRMLDRQGLISLEGRRGSFVRNLSQKEMNDLIQVRATVSGVQMAEAARADNQPEWAVTELKAGLALLQEIAGDEDGDAASYILVRRIVAIVTLAIGGNIVVGRLAGDLEREVTTLWANVVSKERQQRSAGIWTDIIASILSRDVAAARLHGRRVVEKAFDDNKT